MPPFRQGKLSMLDKVKGFIAGMHMPGVQASSASGERWPWVNWYLHQLWEYTGILMGITITNYNYHN